MSERVEEQAPRLSERVAQLQPSATIGLLGRVKAMQAAGLPVLSFGQGEPDFPTPVPIKMAAFEAITRNYTRYTPAGGLTELRQCIAQRVTQDTGIAYQVEQITATAGVKESLFLAFLALLDPGDEVIIPAPYWVSYAEQARVAGGVPVIIPTTEQHGFKLHAEQLAAHLTPRTRAIVLSSPVNPTGAVYTAEELTALADVVRQYRRRVAHPPVVITDEIYDQICYVDYARWLRVAPDLADLTLVMNGLSKTYAMTGWRLGYTAGPEPIVNAMRTIQGHSTTHPSSVSQYAAIAAFSPSDEITRTVAAMTATFRERRDLVVRALSQIPGVQCVRPDGAFYVFPNVTGLLGRTFDDGTVCETSADLVAFLLEKAYVSFVPGEAFGVAGYLRISYAQRTDLLSEGMHRFANAVT